MFEKSNSTLAFYHFLSESTMATADLNTGTTPAPGATGMKRATSHQNSLSIHMAKAAPTLGSALTPEQYRQRKVALITGQSLLPSRANCAHRAFPRYHRPGRLLPHRIAPRERLRSARAVRLSYTPFGAIPEYDLRRIRRSSSFNTGRIEHLYKDVHERTYHLAESQLRSSSPFCDRSQYDFALWRYVLHPTRSPCTTADHHVAQISPTPPTWSTSSRPFSRPKSTTSLLSRTSRFPLTWQSTPFVVVLLASLPCGLIRSLQGDVDGLGTLRLLDAIRTCGLTHHVRFYQVSHLHTLMSRSDADS